MTNLRLGHVARRTRALVAAVILLALVAVLVAGRAPAAQAQLDPRLAPDTTAFAVSVLPSRLATAGRAGTVVEIDALIPEDSIPVVTLPADSIPDATLPDTTLPDTTISDVTIPDVTIPDVTIPDVTIPDVTIPDVTIPDTTIPDTTIPDTTIPDTTIPDTTVPETTVPETTIPDTTIPDTTIPDTTIPDTTIPDTTIPDTTVPETTVPETTVPETTIPHVTVPPPPPVTVPPTFPPTSVPHQPPTTRTTVGPPRTILVPVQPVTGSGGAPVPDASGAGGGAASGATDATPSMIAVPFDLRFEGLVPTAPRNRVAPVAPPVGPWFDPRATIRVPGENGANLVPGQDAASAATADPNASPGVVAGPAASRPTRAEDDGGGLPGSDAAAGAIATISASARQTWPLLLLVGVLVAVCAGAAWSDRKGPAARRGVQAGDERGAGR